MISGREAGKLVAVRPFFPETCLDMPFLFEEVVDGGSETDIVPCIVLELSFLPSLGVD